MSEEPAPNWSGRGRPRRMSFDVLEERRLLSVTVPEIETGLNQLGAVVNQSVKAVNLLGQVPFLKGLGSTLTGGANNLQTTVNALINDFEKTAQPSESVQAFLTSNPKYASSNGTLTISNVGPIGTNAYQFMITAAPAPLDVSLSVNGGQAFGIFKQLNLGTFVLSASNQVQLQAVVQIDSSGNLLIQRSSQTFIKDTPTIALAKSIERLGNDPGRRSWIDPDHRLCRRLAQVCT